MSKVPVQFNVNNNHPLIPRELNYTLDKKLVSIHSEDRDYCKWPHANHFEITLPEDMLNVQSLRLAEAAVPANFYNISKIFCNTKLAYSYEDTNVDCSSSQPTCNAYCDISGNSTIKVLELCDGFYTPVQLASVLTKLFCKNGDDVTVIYNSITQKFCFITDGKNLSLLFDYMTPEDRTCDNCRKVWCQSTKWGLGSYLGFDKKTYQSAYADCNDDCICCSDIYNSDVTAKDYCSSQHDTTQCIVAPMFPKLTGEQVMYLEVDKYDSYDELCPYPSKSNNLFNASYGGTVNAAFAKIPLVDGPSSDGTTINFDSLNYNFLNISYHDPPLERVKKLKFKFRYHNGVLVDFKDVPFTFTIEFNCLRNDIEKNYKVNTPYMY